MNFDRYFKKLFGEDASIINRDELGGKDSIKGFGYGRPLHIELDIDGERKDVVLSTMKKNTFGHDHFSDRAQILLWQHNTFNKLPKHVKSFDVGFFTNKNELISARDADEFFIVTEMVEGSAYANDLDRIKDTGRLKGLDIERTEILASYLTDIHSVKGKDEDKDLYIRKVRDIVGHGECIFGIIDNYPDDLDYITPKELCDIEKGCIELRYKLKRLKNRVCLVHGDFHPWNILFKENNDFTLLDRSRGEWGEAADDVTSLTINYLFYSLLQEGEIKGSFKRLFDTFFNVYLEKTGDLEILETVQLFYIFRTLVVASPVWYPSISDLVRRKLFNFIYNMLECDRFEYEDAGRYFG
ncbi:phosphotransferase [Candidatus Methanoliparum sp. LAM-1]|nr:phosphotransferase [Candidatus Methanoliparum sp. LAM-1]